MILLFHDNENTWILRIITPSWWSIARRNRSKRVYGGCRQIFLIYCCRLLFDSIVILDEMRRRSTLFVNKWVRSDFVVVNQIARHSSLSHRMRFSVGVSYLFCSNRYNIRLDVFIYQISLPDFTTLQWYRRLRMHKGDSCIGIVNDCGYCVQF